MEKLLCPSMMCANYGNLSEEVEKLEKAGADIFHIDIMDGQFWNGTSGCGVYMQKSNDTCRCPFND